MSDEIHHKYRSNLRGNQDVLLADIRRSPEFEAIEQKYLKNVFMGIYRLLGRVEGNDDNARKVYACADEISRTFKISKKNALQLLLTANVPAVYGARYMPHVKQDGDEVVMRFGRKTTLADIKAGISSKMSKERLAALVARNLSTQSWRSAYIANIYSRGEK